MNIAYEGLEAPVQDAGIFGAGEKVSDSGWV